MPATDKTINSRVKIRYDTYTSWAAQNPVLLEGEVAIVSLAAGVSPSGDDINPVYLMKVGDGSSNFSALNWISGLAADVYDWAKAPTKPSYGYNEIDGLTTYIGTLGHLSYTSNAVTLNNSDSSTITITKNSSQNGNIQLTLPSTSGTLALLSDITGGGSGGGSTVSVSATGTSTTAINYITVNNAEYLIEKSIKVPLVNTAAAATFSLDPYKMYNFGNLNQSMVLSFNAVASGYCAEYLFRFVAGASAAITLPSGCKYNNGVVPTFTTGRTYEYNITDNLVVVGEFY